MHVCTPPPEMHTQVTPSPPPPPPTPTPQISQISADDYFTKNAEFSTWLLETKHKYFSDLSTEETHDVFAKEFVPLWNAGKLPGKLYAGLAGTTLRRSAHHWGIKGGASGAVCVCVCVSHFHTNACMSHFHIGTCTSQSHTQMHA